MQVERKSGGAATTTAWKEVQRLDTLRQYDILDTPPEASFDRISRFAARFFDVPIAIISMTDEQRQWIKSCVGIDVCEVRRDISPCARVAIEGRTLVVEDMRAHPSFATNPLVTGPPHIRFYAGAPLRTADGVNLGTLCLIDHQPRTLTDVQVETLVDLADEVIEQMERRRAEREARAAERQVEGILESITDAFVAIDREGRFTYVNAQAEAQLRRTRDEMLGASIWEVLPELAASSFRAACRRAAADGTPVKFMEYVAPFDCWFDARVYPFEQGLSLYFSDVTERVREQRFQAAQARVLEMVAAGASRQDTLDALAQAVEERLPDLSARILGNDAEVAAAGPGWTRPILGSEGRRLGTFVFHSPGGRRPAAAEQGIIEAASNLAGIAIERYEREQTLRDNEARLQAIFNQAALGIAQTDLAGHYVLVNERFCALLGRTEDEVVGRHIDDLTHPDDRAASQQALAALRAGQNHIAFEKQYLRADGSAFWAINYVSRITDAAGNMVAALGIVADLTDRKRAEELQRSNRELEQFAYVASHDLQEPLRKIQSFGDVLAESYGAALDQEGRCYLDRIQQAAVRMQRLIGDLLAYSRVTSRAHPFRKVDLQDVVQEVLGDLEDQVDRMDGRVEVGPLPTLLGDPLQLRQLVQNLIGNALKFHRPGTPPIVKVYAEQTADGGVPLLRLCVEDNGIGFETKYLERIFQPFQRLHRPDQYEGSGIGLAICKKIAEQHGGDITAESIRGEGTTFIVTLPLAQD